jgi:hypothetical protein
MKQQDKPTKVVLQYLDAFLDSPLTPNYLYSRPAPCLLNVHASSIIPLFRHKALKDEGSLSESVSNSYLVFQKITLKNHPVFEASLQNQPAFSSILSTL